MSLFSFLRKNKQEAASGDNAFYSRAEEESNKVRGQGKRRQRGQGNRDSEAADPVLPEKKRARRRLIGAIALVLAAIIGVPMILDSEPKQVADDIAIQIPSKDKATAMPSPPAAAATSKVTAAVSLDPKEEIVEAPPPAEPAKQAERSASRESAKAIDATGEMQGAITADKTKREAKLMTEPTKAGSVADSKQHSESPSPPKSPNNAAEKKVDDGARAKALLEGKPDPKTAEKKSGKFVIQVAALATKEKVDELQHKLKDVGIASYTQKVATESGDRTRIRVGPFTSKEDAEKVRAKIIKLGLNGTLVPV